MKHIVKVISLVVLISVLTGCSKKDCSIEKENINDTFTKAENLIIDSECQEQIYNGSILISGEGIQDITYEGMFSIVFDKDGRVHIKATDDVRERGMRILD